MAVKHKDLKEVVKQLKGASKMHLAQSKTIAQHIKDMGKSPFAMKSPFKKLSKGCIAAAKRKFDVYPSAYANAWASKQQKKGKC
jgi:hypothetical protein